MPFHCRQYCPTDYYHFHQNTGKRSTSFQPRRIFEQLQSNTMKEHYYIDAEEIEVLKNLDMEWEFCCNWKYGISIASIRESLKECGSFAIQKLTSLSEED